MCYLLDVCLLFRVAPRDVARVDTVAAVRSFIAVAMRSRDSQGRCLEASFSGRNFQMRCLMTFWLPFV